MYKSIYGKETPEWFLKGNIYQINPRTFSDEGTLSAITKELPFLAELGFKVIYLCPIFEADATTDNWSPRQIASNTNNPKNPYRMNDFFAIDEEYGNMDDLAELVFEAHKYDLKIFLDLVYLHIGPNASIFKNHPEFAMHDENGNIILTRWNFPQLNYESEGLREYLWCNMTYYIGVLDIDGFRCDVGDEVPLDFWQEGKRRIRAIKKEAVMINEGTKKEYLCDVFDADYAFSWHEAYNVLSGSVTLEALREAYSTVDGDIERGMVFLRDMDNHDTVTDWPQRLEAMVGHDGMELVQVLNYIIDGIPMVYCGNELGDTARLSMFANRFHMGDYETTDRSKKNSDFSIRRQAIIKKLNLYKRESNVLCYGKTSFISNSENDRIFSFSRCYKNEKIIFIGNFSNETLKVKFDEQIGNGRIEFESKTPIVFEKDSTFIVPPYGYSVIYI